MNNNSNGAIPELSSLYPEIFYRLQPYIMMICDQLDANSIMPDQNMTDQITDNIYSDIIDLHPDLLEYARSLEESDSILQNTPASAVISVTNPRIYRRGFRRRGILKDLIEILLLTELAKRRRR